MPATVWIFDENRRVYARNGGCSGGPIYREHWYEQAVVGQTRRSWILRHGRKVPKTGGRGFAFTKAEVDDDVFCHDHIHAICERLRNVDATTLRKVAELIGYNPTL